MSVTVDEYVRKKVLPEHQQVVKMIRQIMHELAPGAIEMIGYNMPVWKGKRILAWIIATRKDITFGFTRGTRFKDKYGVLRGVGKSARHIKLKSTKDVDKKVLGYYIKQALELDTE